MNEALDKSITTLFLRVQKNIDHFIFISKRINSKKGEFNKFVPQEILNELKSF